MPITEPIFVEAPERSSADLPKIYTNGFEINLGTGDVHITLKRTGEDVAVIDMSYTLAKTMVALLGRAIAVLEQATGNEIMTTEFIDEKLKVAREIAEKSK